MGSPVAGLFGLLFFPGVLAIMILIAHGRQPPAGRIDDRGQFAVHYVREHWKRVVGGVLVWLTVNAFAGVVVLLVAALSGAVGGPAKQKAGYWKAAAARDRREWLASLGATAEERVARINEMFDRKDRTLSVVRYTDVYDGPKSVVGFLGFRISRHLAAMEVREREILRVAELMSATTDDGDAEADRFSAAKFGLLWGNGKATIDDGWYLFPNQSGVKDWPGAVAWYASLYDASVDSVITRVLRDVEQARAKGGTDERLAPVAREIEGRLTGGSTWLSPQEIQTSIYAPAGQHALRLGLLDGAAAPLTYSGRRAVITVAPPGAGKTQCNVFPTLLSWTGPAVVLDPKGEIYEGTSRWRAQHVGPVYRFNPLDPGHSHRYNPLAFVRADADYIWEDARFLADMMMVPSGAADRFWEDKARDVITAAIAHVCYSAPPDQRPMSQLVDIVHGGKPWEEMLAGLQTAVDVRAMVRAGTSLATTLQEKTRDSVLQVAQSSLSAWSGARIDRATQRSDWSPLDLRGGTNPTIYICLKPGEIRPYLSILRVLLAQHIQMLLDEVQPPDAVPILFMLDELPQLGHMPPVEKAIEIGRGYGLWIWMYAQSLGQLQEAYPNADGLVGSCAVRIFMNPSAHDGLAEKLSEELGYRQSALDGTRLRVVEASELAGPTYRDYVLVLGAGSKPVKVRKAFAWQDPEITSRLGSL